MNLSSISTTNLKRKKLAIIIFKVSPILFLLPVNMSFLGYMIIISILQIIKIVNREKTKAEYREMLKRIDYHYACNMRVINPAYKF